MRDATREEDGQWRSERTTLDDCCTITTDGTIYTTGFRGGTLHTTRMS